jgi:hypothetical protein
MIATNIEILKGCIDIMAKKTRLLNLRNIKFTFTHDPTPLPPPPPPPSYESGVILANFEADLPWDRTGRIVSLIVTHNEIKPRYRRRANSENLGTIVDLTLHGSHATVKHVFKMLSDNECRARLRRIVDSERGLSGYEPKWEASQLVAFIFWETD